MTGAEPPPTVEADPPPDVTVESPSMDAVDAVTGLWVDLAADQRRHGSHILPDANRATVRESVGHRIATDGLVVARARGEGSQRERSQREGTTGEGGESADGTATASDTGDRLVGFATFGPETAPLATGADRGVVEDVYVVPDRRGEGIGAALVGAAERSLFADGVDAVRLEAMAANEEARRFYERLGYRPHRVELEKRRYAAEGGEPGGDSDSAKRRPGSAESDTHSRED
ncbi:MAG: GNAT family N-acetyltransferase [Halolamina sp.]